MIILGTGIDIVEIDRISKAIEKSQMFMKKVFTQNEIEYFISKNNNPSHIAGGFAAKEAVLKALGTGLRGMEWRDIEILRDKLGKPSVRLYKKANDIAVNNGIINIHISISHCRDYAVAQAVAVGSEKESMIV